MDDVLALSLFGIASSLAFSQEGVSSFDGSAQLELILNITSAPLQLVGGIVGGWCIGKIVGLVTISTHVAATNDRSSTPPASISSCPLSTKWYLPAGLVGIPSSLQFLATARFFSIFVPCMAIVMLTDEYGYKGLGYLCTMVAGAIAAQEWNACKSSVDVAIGSRDSEFVHRMVVRPELMTEEHRAFLGSKGASTWIGSVWWLFQPILFSLIGTAVDVQDIEASVIGFAVAILAVGLVLRLAATYLAVGGAGLEPIERTFVALAWLPKATVQAAIGTTILDTAISNGASDEVIGWGEDILTISVLSILLTAPIGALIIAYTGRRWLHHEIPSVNAEIELSLDMQQQTRHI